MRQWCGNRSRGDAPTTSVRWWWRTEGGMPDMIVGASYAGVATIAKNLCWLHDEHLIETNLFKSTSFTHLKSKKMRESDHLILIASGKIWEKAPPHLVRINERWQYCEYCKSSRLCALPSDKAHGATKNISDNASATSRDCRSKAPATAPHISPTHVAHLSHSSTPKRTKKPPCAQQESQCARRLNDGLP